MIWENSTKIEAIAKILLNLATLYIEYIHKILSICSVALIEDRIYASLTIESQLQNQIEVVMAVQMLKRLFTVEEYYQMAAAGILTENDRVELIEGEIVEMAAIGSRHGACVNRLNSLFSQLLGIRAIVGVQNPVRLNNNSEPQPDIALLQPRPDFYADGHPQPQDIFLIIEVADTTIEYDREVKLPLYASSRISEIWIINLNHEVIEVYRNPNNNRYESVQIFQRGSQITIPAFAELSLAVNDILG